MKFVLSLVTVVLMSAYSIGQSTVVGKWITIDDKTNKKKSIVELYMDNGKMYGKIVYLYPREGRPENAKCTECKDDRKNKPLMGLQIVRNLEKDGDDWGGGTIVDPETGKVYTVKMWLEDDNSNSLKVRGYIGPLYRTQTWVRVK